MEQENGKIEILEQGSTIIIGTVPKEKPKTRKKKKSSLEKGKETMAAETKASKMCELPLHKPSKLPTLCMKAGLISGEIIILEEVQQYILENKHNPFGNIEIILKDLAEAGYELKYPSNFEKELGLSKPKITKGLSELYSYLRILRNEYEVSFDLRRQAQHITPRGEKKQHLLIDRLIKIIELIPGLSVE